MLAFYKTDDFKELQREWYGKLKATGFVDQEKIIGGEPQLIQNSAHAYCWAQNPTVRENKAAYYELLAGYVHTKKFDDEVDALILTRLSEGIKIKQICIELEAIGQKRHRQTVRYTIRKYEQRWKLRSWEPEQLHSQRKKVDMEAVTEPQSTYTVVSYPGSQIPEAYRSFLFSKWLRSLRSGNDYYKLIDSDSYFLAYHRYIEILLTRPHAVVRFAVLTEDPDVVFGFSLIESQTLHYVYVHKDCRRQGIGLSLVPLEGIKNITHLTKTGIAIWTHKLPEAKFNPFI